MISPPSSSCYPQGLSDLRGADSRPSAADWLAWALLALPETLSEAVSACGDGPLAAAAAEHLVRVGAGFGPEARRKLVVPCLRALRRALAAEAAPKAARGGGGASKGAARAALLVASGDSGVGAAAAADGATAR